MKNLRLLISIFVFLFPVVSALAQVPLAIPYQAVARDNSGNPLISQAISLRFSLRYVTANGMVVYQETHSVTTNTLGLFSVNIGQGVPVMGNLSTVNWAINAKFIQVEMDPAGGNAYIDMGTTQLMSVPYALFAGKSGDLPAGINTGNTMRWNGTAWVADDAIFNNGTNVGIGTATPTAKLDVAGAVKITDGTQGAGKVLKSDTAGLASWGALSGNDILSTPVPLATLNCPVVTGTVSTGNNPISVAVSGLYAYVMNYNINTMQVINITNPAAPVVAGSVATGVNPISVAVSGSYAYVVNQNGNTMQVINVSNPASPTVVGVVSTGNNPNSVAVSGNYAYVVNSGSNTMQVINITNPAAPVVAGSVATGITPYSVAVSGNYAYVVNLSSNTMQVINIANPAAPVVAGTVVTGTGPVSVAVSGSYACVLNYFNNTIQIIDISNPAVPSVAGSVATGNNPISVAVSGNYANVVNYTSNTMQVINISNPASPVVAGSVATGSGPGSVAVLGNYAYAVNGSGNTMQVINLLCSVNYGLTVNPVTGQTTAVPFQWNTSGNDMSNANTGNVGIGTNTPSAKLDVAGAVKITDGTQGAGKVLKSDAAGLATWGVLSGNDILSTPVPAVLSCPVVAGSVATGNNPYSVAVSGNYAYVVNRASNTMQILNITNPAAPVVAGSVTTGNFPNSVAVSGNYAYVVNFNSNTMQVINITNPASPVVVGSVATGNYPNYVTVSGNYAYVLNVVSTTMQVINITNPASPTVSGSVLTGSDPFSVAVSGNYAYVVNSSSNTMQVINITNPAAPVVVGSVATGTSPTSVVVSGSYAYVTNYSSNTMQVINISNPASPVVAGSVATGTLPRSVAVSGNYAFVGNISSITIQVINITNPASPTVSGSLATGGQPYSLAVSGNYAYVVNSTSNTLQVINLSCSANFGLTINPATGQTTALPFQWNTSGNNISNANTGNVGIGTTTPYYTTELTVKAASGSNSDLALLPGGAGTGWNFAALTAGDLRVSKVDGAGSSTDYLTITSSGNVGIGATSPFQRLTVSNGSTIGTYTPSGWVHSSDERLKTNIKPLEGSLDKILKLQPVSYNWKATPETDKQIGFIAQQVEKIFPEAVVIDSGGSYGMAYQNLTAPLVAAMKEQQAQIEALVAENKKLKTENAESTQTLIGEIEKIKAQLALILNAEK